jgi:hypothetical protein
VQVCRDRYRRLNRLTPKRLRICELSVREALRMPKWTTLGQDDRVNPGMVKRSVLLERTDGTWSA